MIEFQGRDFAVYILAETGYGTEKRGGVTVVFPNNPSPDYPVIGNERPAYVGILSDDGSLSLGNKCFPHVTMHHRRLKAWFG